MALIELNEALAWAEKTKLNPASLDVHLVGQQEAYVRARLAGRYGVDAWNTSATTPALVRKCIAMLYMGWYYLRTYADEDYGNDYAERLLADAELLLEGLASGTISLPDVEQPPEIIDMGTVGFEPTDFGFGPVFEMDKVW